MTRYAPGRSPAGATPGRSSCLSQASPIGVATPAGPRPPTSARSQGWAPSGSRQARDHPGRSPAGATRGLSSCLSHASPDGASRVFSTPPCSPARSGAGPSSRRSSRPADPYSARPVVYVLRRRRGRRAAGGSIRGGTSLADGGRVGALVSMATSQDASDTSVDPGGALVRGHQARQGRASRHSGLAPTNGSRAMTS